MELSKMPTLQEALSEYLFHTNNALTYFMNEQIRNATEILEDRIVSDIEISAYGKIQLYQDGTRVFLWKGKPTILFTFFTTSAGLEIEAQHKYDDERLVKFSEDDVPTDATLKEVR
jgi:hypothetical protein